MKNLFNQAAAGLRVLLVMTVLLGVAYPLGVWAVSRLPGLQANAEGSIVTRDGQAVGSELIGVDPVAADPAADPWFHTRPSATGDPSTSGGSNKSGFNEDLVAEVGDRQTAIAAREGVAPAVVPADAVTASASGVDPSISVAYAELQVPRVARNTGVPPDRVAELVREHTTGVLPGVNVLQLNLAVRHAAGR
ncbi:potassium-transporting ATPase subunit C [Amycolatopsis magusensis]|uniref:Potassium-transporting ATPase KdpC subunit n=1 Tax=Amycolatopsis magusensis TaxID=882444 RepID=A0ABS4Q471_9PSEU|nr:potassium-transporting ATPase subunit C [Amycolatopsis magusensis]MBP2186480.1 K+-transporting ATPase ATPase C chain [Amycolatopsis magusensis]